MILNINDVKKIYISRFYKAYNIEKSDDEPNVYTFDISYKKNCITDGLVCRRYDGDTVYHESLSFHRQYRQQGHGKKIHKLECKAYRGHGFSKIVLNAARDGVCAWSRLGFKILDSSIDNVLLDIFRDFLYDVYYSSEEHETKKKNIEDIMKVCTDIKKLFSKDMKSYILPNNKQSFADYLYDENRFMGPIKMEKEL